MSAAPMPTATTLLGSREHLDVSRALSEFQARRPICIIAPDANLIVLPVEGLDDKRLQEFMALCSPVAPRLIITQQRARALGMETSTPLALSLPPAVYASGIFALAAGGESRFAGGAQAASFAARAAIRLVKLARGLPAILVADMPAVEGETLRSI